MNIVWFRVPIMETKDKITKMCQEFGYKRSAIIKATEANKSTVSTWFNGISKPTGIYLTRLSKFFSVDPEWLIDDSQDWLSRLRLRESTQHFFAAAEQWESKQSLGDSEVEVSFYKNIEASAGFGYNNSTEPEPRTLRFSSETLAKLNISPENVVCIKVQGNSMEPVLPSGATVGVDTSSCTIEDGKLYAIEHDGLLRIKVLHRITGSKIRLRSYNHEEYEDEIITVDPLVKLRIVGRVFWYSVIL